MIPKPNEQQARAIAESGLFPPFKEGKEGFRTVRFQGYNDDKLIKVRRVCSVQTLSMGYCLTVKTFLRDAELEQLETKVAEQRKVLARVKFRNGKIV